MRSAVEGPNYSAHVVDAIPAMVKNLRRQGMASDAETLRAWRGMIQRSVKFLLPPAGLYFSAGKGLREGVYPQRMPFPLLSLEVPYPQSSDAHAGEKSTRRHILCQEATMLLRGDRYEIINAPSDPEGFFVYIFAWRDATRSWMPQASAAYIRYDVPTGPIGNATYPGEAWAHNAHSTFGFSRVPVLNQIWERTVLQVGPEEADRAFTRDTAEEVRIAFEFLQVLACRNVRQVETPPPLKLNAARAKADKLPIDRFYTLKIGDVAIGRPHDAWTFTGGYKVREHLRSGHIRRLPDRQIWVTDTIVAFGSREGKVTKRYEVTA
jgi:hypothetical protein